MGISPAVLVTALAAAVIVVLFSVRNLYLLKSADRAISEIRLEGAQKVIAHKELRTADGGNPLQVEGNALEYVDTLVALAEENIHSVSEFALGSLLIGTIQLSLIVRFRNTEADQELAVLLLGCIATVGWCISFWPVSVRYASSTSESVCAPWPRIINISRRGFEPLGGKATMRRKVTLALALVPINLLVCWMVLAKLVKHPGRPAVAVEAESRNPEESMPKDMMGAKNRIKLVIRGDAEFLIGDIELKGGVGTAAFLSTLATAAAPKAAILVTITSQTGVRVDGNLPYRLATACRQAGLVDSATRNHEYR